MVPLVELRAGWRPEAITLVLLFLRFHWCLMFCCSNTSAFKPRLYLCLIIDVLKLYLEVRSCILDLSLQLHSKIVCDSRYLPAKLTCLHFTVHQKNFTFPIFKFLNYAIMSYNKFSTHLDSCQVRFPKNSTQVRIGPVCTAYRQDQSSF